GWGVGVGEGGADGLAGLGRGGGAPGLPLPVGAVWIAAERVALFRALWPHGRLEPSIVAPGAAPARGPSPEEALREILRGRLEGQGPITQEALGRPLGLEPAKVAGALAALENEGVGRARADAAGGGMEGGWQ